MNRKSSRSLYARGYQTMKNKICTKIVHGEKSHQFNDSDLTLQYIFHQILDILFFYLEKKPRFFHTLKLQPSFELWTYIYDN